MTGKVARASTTRRVRGKGGKHDKNGKHDKDGKGKESGGAETRKCHTSVARSDIFVGTVPHRKSMRLTRRPSRTKMPRCSRPLNMLGSLLYEKLRAARAARPGRESLLIDSGAEQHVCPPGFHAEFPVVQGKREIVSISGEPLQYYGQRSVKTAISDGSSVMPVSVDFCVSDVTAPCVSLGKMVEEGIEFFFSKSKGCWMSKDALDPEATSIGIEQVGRTFEVHEAKMRPKKDLVALQF